MALEALKLDDTREARMLTQRELHLRIQDVAEEVLASAAPAADDPMAPRIITAGELVRRMKPFLVYN